jgi:hypothetical protein
MTRTSTIKVSKGDFHGVTSLRSPGQRALYTLILWHGRRRILWLGWIRPKQEDTTGSHAILDHDLCIHQKGNPTVIVGRHLLLPDAPEIIGKATSIQINERRAGYRAQLRAVAEDQELQELWQLVLTQNLAAQKKKRPPSDD